MTGTNTAPLDPVTFEVIKHRLWQINDEQNIAIKTISASPIVVEGNDFNTGIFTADGALVTAGIGSLVHVATMGDALRSIMENATRIRDGDVFMLNDPFMGALHQNDLVMASPLFIEGEIVLWVGNVLHHPDVGGIDEGSFCINARNLYQDPPRYFLKIVDEGELSKEVEHTFVTNSRLPDMVALDLRAQIGAINVAQNRLRDLLEEYGCTVIKTVMEKAIDLAERQVRDIIQRLPEGSWTGIAYMDGVRVGSDDIHEVRVRLTREGDRLHFDYTGSSPQVDAAVNCTWHGCVAGTTVPLYSFLCQGDIDWNDGLKRCVHVTAPEGSVVNVRFPAPVSISTVGFRWLVTVAATQAVAKMLDASDEFRDRACPSWNSSSNCNNLFGITEDGKRVGMLLSDHRGGGAAGRSFGDGFSHAGNVTSYAASLGNVESTEWKLPVLYLFRHQLPDSGGAGEFRGGLTSAAALTPFGIDTLTLKSTNTAGTDQTNAHGIKGGYPGAGSQSSLLRNAGIRHALAENRLPGRYSELSDGIDHLPSKAEAQLYPGDVFIFHGPGGGGYGDPTGRDAEQVATDVANGRVSVALAARLYGVSISGDGTADVEATRQLRTQIREQRLQDAETDTQPFECPACGGAASAIRTRSIGAAGPWRATKWDGISPNFELEEQICVSCGALISVDEVRTGH
jgi:N-methylhydantoinase B